MAAPLYPCIAGKVVVAGYAPDGDSVRFIPADPRQLGLLSRSSSIRVGSDGSVQVRLEAIDAPELHYAGPFLGQPLGAIARDALLGWIGFSKIAFADDGVTVASSSPSSVPVAILARSVEAHGRPIAYLLRDHRVHGKPKSHHVNEALLARTANHALLEEGLAYLLAYTSLPHVHLRALRAVAQHARHDRRGVWAQDATMRGFALHGRRSIGPHGALVFPKLFRRCVDFLADRARGFHRSFCDWLDDRHERVRIPHAANVPFRSIVRAHDDHLALATDLLDLVFVEQ